MHTPLHSRQSTMWKHPEPKFDAKQKKTVYGPPLGFIAKLIDDKVREYGGSSCTQRSLTLESSAAANPENRPFSLTRLFRTEAPSASKLSSPLDGTVTSRRLKLQSVLGAGVNNITYQFREGKTGRFVTIPTSLVRNAEGKEVSWPITLGQGATKTEALYFDAAHATSALRRPRRRDPGACPL